MLRKSLLVLYTALALGANLAGQTVWAETGISPELADLRQGDMKKLALHPAPQPLNDVVLLDAEDTEIALSSYKGKWVLVNFWATWCAPCRKEMPSLDRLQADLPELTVLPVATGRNAVPGIKSFYAEAQINQLPIIRDPKSELARNAAVLALPVTLILNPDGQEVGRLIGDADWASDSAKAILTALMAQP